MIRGVWIGTFERDKTDEAKDFMKRVAAYYTKTLGVKSSLWRPATGPGRRYVFSNDFDSYAAREQVHAKRDADPAWKELVKEMGQRGYFESTESQIYEGL